MADLSFNSDLTLVREELDKIERVSNLIQNLSDDESEVLSEEFYGFLTQIYDIVDIEYPFSAEQAHTYFKIKTWLEMYKNNICEEDPNAELKAQVEGRIAYLNDVGSVKSRDLFKRCLEALNK